jgi:hypothetical protein
MINVIEKNSAEAGWHTSDWSGANFASGLYIYKVDVKSLNNPSFYSQTKKMLLLK